MEEPTREQVRLPISNTELERRWSETRREMASKGIDALIMQGNNEWLGGYVRYFTDQPAEHAYPITVIFPANDEMTVLASGPKTRTPLPPSPIDRGIKTRVTLPYFLSLNYTNTMDAEAVVATIKTTGDKKVGLVGRAFMSVVFYLYFK